MDPDNRRPVDFALREALLNDIVERGESDILSLIDELMKTKHDGRIKLFLIHRMLAARNRRAELFHKGAYIPLDVSGQCEDSIIAFARRHQEQWSITLAPRFLTSVIREDEDPLGQTTWRDTRVSLPEDSPHLWKDVITGQEVEGDNKIMIGTALKYFPVALLMNEGDT